MSRVRKPLTVIDVDDNEEGMVESRDIPKLTFTKTRKKAQTPRKPAFTPVKILGDVKPKLEPESPTVEKAVPVAKAKRANKAKVMQPKAEPVSDLEVTGVQDADRIGDMDRNADTPNVAGDVKPDIRELESLFDNMGLDHAAKAGNNTSSNLHPSPPESSQPSSSTRETSEPLFIPHDSPDLSASPASFKLSPLSDASSLPGSPCFRPKEPVYQPIPPPPATNTVDLSDLFSGNSPPPPPMRDLRSPSESPSRSHIAQQSYRSDSDSDEPIAGPSRSRDISLSSRSRVRSSPTQMACRPSQSSAGPVDLSDDIDDRVAATHLEEIKPTIKPPVVTPSSKPRRRAFLQFLDLVAKADSEPEDEYEYELNESLGSLKDFIVDDDEVSYYSESEKSLCGVEAEEEDSDIMEVKVEVKGEPSATDSPGDSDIVEPIIFKPNGMTRADAISVDSSDDNDERIAAIKRDEEDGLTDSESDIVADQIKPRTKIGQASGLAFLDDFDESDPEDVLLAAIDKLTIAAPSTVKGKGKAKKGVKAPRWSEERVRIAQEVFDDLDKRVFDNQLGEKGAGAKIVWSKRLLTTAGTAHRKRRRHPDGETSYDIGIQLSEKVCTGEEQILSTVAHEMCHLACWVIDKEFKNPHGKVFKYWGRKVMRKRDDLEVTTKHDYVIEYKFQWRCVDCKKVYKRHSKSIDIEKQRCGICKGKLEPLFETKTRGTSSFQVYLKQNMALAKAALPKASHGDVMRALSARWTEAGADADHESHWKAVLAASRG